jgi:sugar phosphate isomerase/epimerase
MKPLDVGVFLCSTGIEDPFEAAEKAAELGLNNCQLGPLPPKFYTEENAVKLKELLAKLGITCTVAFMGFPGESYASMKAVEETVGLLFPEMVEERKAIAKKVAWFAEQIGTEAVAAHIGFVPHDTSDPRYVKLVEDMRELVDDCKGRGLRFHLETGQETAEELLSFFKAIDRDNIAINFDPANLILYGKDRPIEALDVLGPHVKSCHCKDAVWPTEEGQLGEERPLGEGQVDIPAFVRKLKAVGYQGPLTIEREAGDDRIGDIKRGTELLESSRDA